MRANNDFLGASSDNPNCAINDSINESLIDEQQPEKETASEETTSDQQADIRKNDDTQDKDKETT